MIAFYYTNIKKTEPLIVSFIREVWVEYVKYVIIVLSLKKFATYDKNNTSIINSQNVSVSFLKSFILKDEDFLLDIEINSNIKCVVTLYL